MKMIYQPDEFINVIIKPVLIDLGLNAVNRAQLLLGTALQESMLIYRKQINGRAMGLFQVEEITYKDYYNSYLIRKKDLLGKVLAVGQYSSYPKDYRVVKDNDKFACALACIHYYRIPKKLPIAGDIEGQSRYYKQYYNTPLGAATLEEYIDKWNRYANDINWEEY